jgi:hypothetical protein
VKIIDSLKYHLENDPPSVFHSSAREIKQLSGVESFIKGEIQHRSVDVSGQAIRTGGNPFVLYLSLQQLLLSLDTKNFAVFAITNT